MQFFSTLMDVGHLWPTNCNLAGCTGTVVKQPCQDTVNI